MAGVMQWITELNQSNHLGFAVLTVVTMAGIGVTIAAVAEVVFKALGVKTDKIEIQH